MAYHDSDTTNTLGAFRSDGVDIKTCVDTTGCGYALGVINLGEWTKYSVSVTQAGSYTFSARVATINSAQSFHVEIDGVNVSGSIAVPVNETVWDGGWATVTKTGITLTAGVHTMRFVMDTSNYMDVNNFTWTFTDTTAPAVPTGLAATAVSTSQINLAWSASTDNVGVTGYNVYLNGAKIGTSNSNSFSNTGLAASSVYSYTVAAYDAAGNTSAQSTPAVSEITSGGGVSAIAVGSRVITTANLNVRQTASPSGTKFGTQPIGAQGAVIGGPTSARGHTWWNINYDTGADGWSVGDYLSTVPATSSPAVGMTTGGVQIAAAPSLPATGVQTNASVITHLKAQIADFIAELNALTANLQASVGNSVGAVGQ
jgi:chitodextrinase